MTRKIDLRTTSLTLAAGALALAAGSANADQVILDDLIVDGSACIGFDCVNGESFGFDTLRLKENNLRIKAQDTSTSASFPTNDWQITFNDSANGGAEKFSIDDITGGRTPFTLEAGAPSHSLYVEDGGRVGFGTSTPVVDLHVKSGNTPTLRLEQDGTSGFQAQTWDLAGNEANFFIRDATNGSTLPFRLRPGAPSSAIDIAGTGFVGIGTSSPEFQLDVLDNQALLLKLANSAGGATLRLDPDDNGTFWNLTAATGGNALNFARNGNATGTEMVLAENGDLTIAGGLISTGGGGACTVADPCDAVFDPEVYAVPSIEEHAALMWENKHLPAVGPTGPGIPLNMTEKMVRMLNELEHAHIYIEQLNAALVAQGEEIEALKRVIAE